MELQRFNTASVDRSAMPAFGTGSHWTCLPEAEAMRALSCAGRMSLSIAIEPHEAKRKLCKKCLAARAG